MKKITKHLLSLAILAIMIVPVLSIQAATGPTPDNVGIGTGADSVGTNLNLGSKSPIATVTSLINTMMVFLGLIAVGIVLLGGFKWMTAMGSDEKINEAKKLMGSGAIGIIIILSAWGISKFILEKAISVTA